MATGLREKLASGSFWSVLTEVLTAGGRALSYFVYARYLSPADFGVVGFCLLWINAFPLIIDNSLSMALINDREESQSLHSTIFYMNLAVSLIGILILLAGTGLAARMLDDSRVLYVLPAMGLQILFNSLCATHLAIARKRFQFRSIVPIRVVATIASVTTGVGLIFTGFGYWGLVAGTVVFGLVQMIMSWLIVPWRPSLIFDRRKANEIRRFAGWVSLDMGVTWAVMSGGGFFLAFFLGVQELGFFRLADQLNTTAMGTIFSPLLPVFYSAFCEVSFDKLKSASLFQRLNSNAAILAWFLVGTIVTAAYPLQALIGTKWDGIAWLIIINAFADGMSYLVILSPSFMRAHDGAKTVAVMRLVMLAAQIAIYSFVAARGLEAFLYGKLFIDLMMYGITYVVLSRRFEVPALRLVMDQVVLGIGVVAFGGAAVLATRPLISSGALVALFAGPMIFTALFGMFLLTWKRQALGEILAALKGRRASAATEN